jgi:WhiB family transcriptional regulator, redox-sensing transcriptional regulator
MSAARSRPTSERWQVRAACRGPQAVAFFPPSHPERKDDRLARESRAKAICASCEVRAECLRYALDIREVHGIWGGLTEAERHELVADEPLWRAGSAR